MFYGPAYDLSWWTDKIVQQTLQQNIYFAVGKQSVLQGWVDTIDCWLSFSLSLFIFGLVFLLIASRMMFKSPPVNFSISFFSSIIASHVMQLCWLMHALLKLLCSLLDWHFYILHDGHYIHYILSLRLVIFFVLKSTLSGTNISTPIFFWWLFTWYLFFYPYIFNLHI